MNELLAKLKEAKGPDRDLDCEIWVNFAHAEDDGLFVLVPAYTSSIDDAASLAKPEWKWTVQGDGTGHGGYAAVWADKGRSYEPAPTVDMTHRTPALALATTLVKLHLKSAAVLRLEPPPNESDSPSADGPKVGQK